jgi:hypothetical protein
MTGYPVNFFTISVFSSKYQRVCLGVKKMQLHKSMSWRTFPERMAIQIKCMAKRIMAERQHHAFSGFRPGAPKL